MRWLDMRRILFVIAIALVWCALPAWVWAQETGADTPQQAQVPPAKARPRIGVALEGGGALGLAHIGVLQWFEDHHIPIDYVAGTSMGGLVGGFYATGMTPDELKTLIEAMDWRKILGDRTPYEDLSFRRKED